MIKGLSLHNFRNIKRARLEFSDDFNVILGANGSGKTSIFEGISFAGFGSSPFGASVSDVILNGQDRAVIHATGHRGDLSIDLCNGKKKIALDQKKVDRVSDILGIFPQTLIGPNEVIIVTGGPAQRRKMLNMHLCQTNPIYTNALRNYDSILQQRNKTLKDQRHFNETTFSAIDIELAKNFEVLVSVRRTFIQQTAPLAKELYKKIAGGLLNIEYRPSFADNASSFIQKLGERRKLELLRRTTTLGAHRDEMFIEVDGRPAREFASWGQKRITSIVILIASSKTLFRKSDKPSILLDDCFAELDEGKTENLLALAPSWGQVFVAAPKDVPIPKTVDAKLYRFQSPGVVA